MRETASRRLFRLAFKALSYRTPAIPVPPQGVTLAGVTVVNPGQDRRSGQTLVVEGDRVTGISPTGAPDGAPHADRRYAGATVLPGLADMHVHIPPPLRELCSLLFLAHGVTTVREVGDADGTTWEARERILVGAVPGPRYFTSGPVLDGNPPFLPTSWSVRDAAQARDTVAALAARGADFIKIHHKISAAALAGVRQAADEHGLRVVGHIPESVPFEQARVWDVQHLDGVVPYPQPPEGPRDFQIKWRDLDLAQIDCYVRTSVEQGLVHTPTLVTSDRLAHMTDPEAARDPALRFLPRYYTEIAWSRENGPPIYRSFSDEILTLMRQTTGRAKEIVRRLHAAGVRLHTGTDTIAVPFVVPGASLHAELAHLVSAGLPVEAAWVAGTRDPGASLGLPLLGTVQVGAPADLLIFGRDPSRDLSALSTLLGVVAQGRLYPKPFLDAALARHRERLARPLYDTLTTALFRVAIKGMALGHRA